MMIGQLIDLDKALWLTRRVFGSLSLLGAGMDFTLFATGLDRSWLALMGGLVLLFNGWVMFP